MVFVCISFLSTIHRLATHCFVKIYLMAIEFRTCAAQWVIEADGSVYPCDFYALDQWKLGNLREDSFAQLEEARRASGFVAWSCRVPEECRGCRWLALCRNGCRRNREPVTAESTGRNYFCRAYANFFSYAYPRLEEICRQLLRQAGR